MSVMPISELHFCIVANSIYDLEDAHFKIDWHETKELVSTWFEMNEEAYNVRYRTYSETPMPAPMFEARVSKGSVDDVQLLKLLHCIAYNIPDNVKSEKWMDARNKLERVIKAVSNKIISEQTNYEKVEWSI